MTGDARSRWYAEAPFWCGPCGTHHRSDDHTEPNRRRRIADALTALLTMIANGLYAVCGIVDRVADAPERRRYEAAREAWYAREPVDEAVKKGIA